MTLSGRWIPEQPSRLRIGGNHGLKLFLGCLLLSMAVGCEVPATNPDQIAEDAAAAATQDAGPEDRPTKPVVDASSPTKPQLDAGQTGAPADSGAGQTDAQVDLDGATDPSAPSEDAGAPSEDASATSEDASVPSEDASAPSEDASAPSEDASAPSEDASAPSEDASAPSEDASAPSQDAGPPVQTCPRGCDDGHACSVDSCDPVSGCVHTALDADADGHATATCDPGDPFAGDDCDDADPTVFPGAADVLGNGKDDNCNKDIDEDEPNVIFVTSSRYALSDLVLGGSSGSDAVDAVCAKLADGAGYQGKFRALVELSTLSMKDRLGKARGFLRPDGRVVADTASDLANAMLRHPILLDQNGKEVPSNDVLTGAAQYAANPAQNCKDLSSTAGTTYFQHGTSRAVSRRAFSLTGYGPRACNLDFRLYCAQVDRSVPIAPPMAPEKALLAFVSSGGLVVGDGIEGADKLCQVDAEKHGLGGDFLALVSTSKASAASRFMDNLEIAVARPDGVLVSDSLKAFLQRNWYTPLNVEASGKSMQVGNFAWIGSADLSMASDSAGTCENWKSQANSGTNYPVEELLLHAAPAGTTNTGSCTATHRRVLCVQQ